MPDSVFKRIPLLEKQVKKIMNLIDGDFAFVYRRKDIIILARDKIGIKPLWYSKSPFAFSSAKKVATLIPNAKLISIRGGHSFLYIRPHKTAKLIASAVKT